MGATLSRKRSVSRQSTSPIAAAAIACAPTRTSHADLPAETNASLTRDLHSLGIRASEAHALFRLRELVEESTATSSERAAISLVLRSGNLSRIVDLLDRSAARLDALRLLCVLSSSKYDAHGTDATRALLRTSDVPRIVRGFLYLSPRALGSGATHEGGLQWLTIRAVVYHSLALLANLTRRPEDGQLLSFSGLERVNELAASADEVVDVRQLPCPWAGAALGRMAQLLQRNVATVTSGMPASGMAALEESDPFASDRPTIDNPLPPPPPPLPPPPRVTYGGAAPTRGFHDVSHLMSLLERLPAHERAATEESAAGAADSDMPWAAAATCIVCLDEMRVGDVCRPLPCGHTFHAKCIDSWLTEQHVRSRGCSCPTCKRALRLDELPPPDADGSDEESDDGDADDMEQGADAE